MRFEELLRSAKTGNMDARLVIFEMYKPLLLKWAMVNEQFDEDLYQELCVTLLKNIDRFRI